MSFYKENCLLMDGIRDCKSDCGHCGFDEKVSGSRMAWMHTFGLSTVGAIRKLVIPKKAMEVRQHGLQ